MTTSSVQRIRDLRLRSHRLSSPAPTLRGAAEHMLATQGQEFWGGRLALAARTKGFPTLRDVDAAFDRGELARSWTMRGTVHVLPARDVEWVLSLTGERQFRAAASRHRTLGLDDESFTRAETAVRGVLRGGNRITRAEFADVLRGIGIDPREQRGVHVLYVLSVRGVVLQGPVVPREGGPTREQYVVLTDEWVTDAATPADPLAEFFTRYIRSHGPAGTADFAWWSGLPIGTARRAADAAETADDRLTRLDDDVWVAADLPRRHPSAPDVIALPPFEEYFLSYADRTLGCAPAHTLTVMTGGAMRPILLARGEIVATWSHSHAAARRSEPPIAEWLVPGGATEAEAAAALERYRRFATG